MITGARKKPVGTSTGTPASAAAGSNSVLTDTKSKISKLKNIDSKLADVILNEVLIDGAAVTWNDIGKSANFGLHMTISILHVVLDLFQWLRRPNISATNALQRDFHSQSKRSRRLLYCLHSGQSFSLDFEHQQREYSCSDLLEPGKL
jgi:hypothetical protein